jgi:uncharacterized repeat protein (TIGR01451 family)
LEDTPTPAIVFTVSDGEVPVASLLVSAASSNLPLLPSAGLALGGSGANRTVTLTPAHDQFGVATITLVVRDAEGLTATNRFDLTVTPVNDAPTLDAISDRAVDEDAAEQLIMLTGITPAQVNEIQALTVTAVSDNPLLVRNPTVNYTSPAATGTLRFQPLPNAYGTARITVTVQDNGGTDNGGVDTVTVAFTVTVRPVNDLPTISSIPDQTLASGQATAALPLKVGDVETPAAQLQLAASSSNAALVPANAIVLSGSGANGTATVSPATNQSGSTAITLTVTDTDGGTATMTFTVTVRPPEVFEVDLPEGDILIIRNFAAPEIEQLKTWIESSPLRVRDLTDGGQHPPVVIVADPEGLRASDLVNFRVVVWNDLGTAGLRPEVVEAISRAWQFGVPLYLIGENLAEALSDATANAAWRQLTGLDSTTTRVESGRVVRQEPVQRINELFLGSLAGIDLVQDFDYPQPLELGAVIRGEIRATVNGAPVLLRHPHFDEAADTGARRLVQNFLATPGSSESVEERRKLFLNGLYWLLGNECDNFAGILDTVANEALPVQNICQPFTLTALVSNNGRCDAGGVVVTNTIADGLEIVSAFIRSVPEGANGGFVEQRGQTLVYGLGRILQNTEVVLETTVRAVRAGMFSNRFALRSNYRAVEERRHIVEAQGAPGAPQRLILTRNASNLTLTATGGCGGGVRLQRSSDLRTWEDLPAAASPDRWTVPLDETQRFFRIGE